MEHTGVVGEGSADWHRSPHRPGGLSLRGRASPAAPPPRPAPLRHHEKENGSQSGGSLPELGQGVWRKAVKARVPRLLCSLLFVASSYSLGP